MKIKIYAVCTHIHRIVHEYWPSPGGSEHYIEQGMWNCEDPEKPSPPSSTHLHLASFRPSLVFKRPEDKKVTGGSILSLVVSFLAFQIGLVGSQSGKMVSALSLFNCSVFYFAHLSCVKIPSKLEVAPHALKMLTGWVDGWSGWYPLGCYDY